MEILRVVGPLVATHRHPELYQASLRLLIDRKGKHHVAVDPCGCRKGNWVFVISGSAARLALDNVTTLTDLTVGGIIDYWDEETGQCDMPEKTK